MTQIETIDEFNPEDVLRLITQALAEHPTLATTFVETQMYDKLSFLLGKYLNPADVTVILGEIRDSFFSGFTKISPDEFYSVVKNCRKCPEGIVQYPPQASVWNTTDPDLMIVVDSPVVLNQYGNTIASHLKAAGFTSSRCNLTFLARCSLINSKDPGEAIKNCMPYLHTEMALLSPKVIVTLGLNAYSVVTGAKNDILREIKGDIFWFGPFAILPESSYGSSYRSQKKTEEEINQYYIAAFKKAHSFIYGTN